MCGDRPALVATTHVTGGGEWGWGGRLVATHRCHPCTAHGKAARVVFNPGHGLASIGVAILTCYPKMTARHHPCTSIRSGRPGAFEALRFHPERARVSSKSFTCLIVRPFFPAMPPYAGVAAGSGLHACQPNHWPPSPLRLANRKWKRYRRRCVTRSLLTHST